MLETSTINFGVYVFFKSSLTVLLALSLEITPSGIYLFKSNNGNTRTRCEMCSKLIIRTPERRH